MNTLEVRIPLDEDIAETCIKAVCLELTDLSHHRSKTRLVYDEGLCFKVEADDLNALRAALNTNLRLVDTTIKLLNR